MNQCHYLKSNSQEISVQSFTEEDILLPPDCRDDVEASVYDTSSFASLSSGMEQDAASSKPTQDKSNGKAQLDNGKNTAKFPLESGSNSQNSHSEKHDSPKKSYFSEKDAVSLSDTDLELVSNSSISAAVCISCISVGSIWKCLRLVMHFFVTMFMFNLVVWSYA